MSAKCVLRTAYKVTNGKQQRKSEKRTKREIESLDTSSPLCALGRVFIECVVQFNCLFPCHSKSFSPHFTRNDVPYVAQFCRYTNSKYTIGSPSALRSKRKYIQPNQMRTARQTSSTTVIICSSCFKMSSRASLEEISCEAGTCHIYDVRSVRVLGTARKKVDRVHITSIVEKLIKFHAHGFLLYPRCFQEN